MKRQHPCSLSPGDPLLGKIVISEAAGSLPAPGPQTICTSQAFTAHPAPETQDKLIDRICLCPQRSHGIKVFTKILD